MIKRRRLPHWRQSGGTFFVTFRLADSLPQELLRAWRAERKMWIKWHPCPWSEEDEWEYENRFGSRLQDWLDQGIGSCRMRRADVRREVESCLLHFDGSRYTVDAFVVMPNHVHLLLTPSTQHELSELVRGIKGVSAKRCNSLLGREGRFWMDESYDRIVRSAAELMAFRNYIADNPKKAGLSSNESSVQLRNTLIL